MTPNRSASLKRLAVMLFDGEECAPSHDNGVSPADDESLISLPWALKEYSDCSLSAVSTRVSSPIWSRQVSGAESALDSEAADETQASQAGVPCWFRSTYTSEREGEVIAIARSGVAHKIMTPSPSSDDDESGEDTATNVGPEVWGLSMLDLRSSIHDGFARAHKDLAKMLAATRVDM